MAKSLSKILLHLVFSTKRRRPSIPQDLCADLHAYLAGAVRALGGEAYRVGGTENHVHLACSLPRTLTVSKLVEQIKKSSSAWIKTRDTRCHGFSWQAGYGAFSVSESRIPEVRRHIENQEEHHRTMTFQEEFRKLCKLHNLEIDERYVWD